MRAQNVTSWRCQWCCLWLLQMRCLFSAAGAMLLFSCCVSNLGLIDGAVWACGGASISESFLINGDIISSNVLGLKRWLVLGTEGNNITRVGSQNASLTQLSLRFIAVSKRSKIWRHYIWGDLREEKKKVLEPVLSYLLHIYIISAF